MCSHVTRLHVCSIWKPTTLFHYCQGSREHKTVLLSAKITLRTGLTLILVDKDSNTAGLQETLLQLLKMPRLKYAI